MGIVTAAWCSRIKRGSVVTGEWSRLIKTDSRLIGCFYLKTKKRTKHPSDSPVWDPNATFKFLARLRQNTFPIPHFFWSHLVCHLHLWLLQILSLPVIALTTASKNPSAFSAPSNYLFFFSYLFPSLIQFPISLFSLFNAVFWVYTIEGLFIWSASTMLPSD